MSAAAVTASADEVSNVGVSANDSVLENDDGYALISKNESIDEDGWVIETEVYTKDDGISLHAADSGSHTYKCKSTWSYNNMKWITMWIEGDFTWDRANDIAEVETDESRCGYIVHFGKYEDQGHTFSYGTDGRTFLFGKKYAYIERTAKIWNCVDNINAKEFRIWLDVNVAGEAHPTPKDSLQS